jgi:esterase
VSEGAAQHRLHTIEVVAEGATPEATVLFLHGILGSGVNWRSFARKLVERVPRFRALLVDLRQHGDSRGFSPPHDVANSAHDLVPLLGLEPPTRAVIGHSFGGKVALELVGLRGAELERAIVVDSNPGARPTARGSETTLAVLSALETVSLPVPTREGFVQAIVAQGTDSALAGWLALNLVRTEAGFALRIDTRDVRALLEDYFARDLWPLVERPPCALHFVLGGRSRVLDDSDRARLGEIERWSKVTTDVIAEAGHWVHVDAPDALLDVVARRLAS